MFFRAYLQNLLTYGMEVKASSLFGHGWDIDSTDDFEPLNPGGTATTNTGFLKRIAWFRDGFATGGDYRTEGLELQGRLVHELMGTDKCMPPGIIVMLMLNTKYKVFNLKISS